jgi:hypothetical protein
MSATKTLTDEQKGIVDAATQLADSLLEKQKAAEQKDNSEQKLVENVDPTLAAVVNLGLIPVDYADSIGDLTITEIIKMQNSAEFKNIIQQKGELIDLADDSEEQDNIF